MSTPPAQRKRYRRWSVQAIIEELQRIDRAGRVRITSNALVAAGHTGLASAIHKYIGSFARARQLARIPAPGRLSPYTIERWDEDRVIGEIRDRNRGGLSLAPSKLPSKLRRAACTYCGSVKNAIEMAGFDYAKVRISSPAWSREQILAALRKGAKSKRAGIGDDGFVTAPVALAARREFGSIRKALIAADLDPERLLRRSHRSRRELVELVRELAEKQPTMTLRELHSHKLGMIIARRYGTMSKGLERLGVDDWPIRVLFPAPSKEEVIVQLRQRHRRGAAMTHEAVCRDDGRLLHAGLKHFGTWRNAMQAIGLGALVGRPSRRPTRPSSTDA